MNREEAIDILFGCIEAHSEEENEALDMAIEALKHERTDEWCTDCKEYDTKKKCCPRFNRVIRGAMNREPSEDGTLEVKVEDATKVGRVLISDDEHRGGLYYPDEDEPQGVSFENDTKIKSCSKDSDLISRTEAIRAITEYNEMPTENCYHEYNHGYKNGMNMAGHFLENMPSADRPRGEWIVHDIVCREEICLPYECPNCGFRYSRRFNFCPNCGADMKGEDK